MPDQELSCPRCKGAMEHGFIPDTGFESAPGTQRWVAGEPEHRFFTGLKLKGRTVRAVRTYRCTRCGYLESYATTATA